MTAPNSPVDICNLALDRTGQSTVANIETPSSKEEQIMSRWYDQTRRALLRSYIWNFAKARIVITRSGTPAFDFADQYTLPNDFLRVISLASDTNSPDIRNFDIEEQNLLCDNNGGSGLKLRYTKDITDVTKFDPLFVSIFSLQLAVNTAYKFTLKPSAKKMISDELTLELGKAISVDSQEVKPKKRDTSKFVQARTRLGTVQSAGMYTVVE